MKYLKKIKKFLQKGLTNNPKSIIIILELRKGRIRNMENLIFILMIAIFFELLIGGSAENDKISLILYHLALVEIIVIITIIVIQILQIF